MTWHSNSRVAVVRESARYCTTPPFGPSESYPEWPGVVPSTTDNPAYRAVRQSLLALGLDSNNADTAVWNPLSALITPGNTVIVKPNLVSHRNGGRRMFGLTDTDSLITHGSVLRPVLDYVAKALQGRGTIIVADCPIQGADWEQILRLTGLPTVVKAVESSFPGIAIVVRDFRLAKAGVVGSRVVSRESDDSRMDEYQEVDLGELSALVPLMDGVAAFGVAQYGRRRMARAHTPERNLYLLPKPILDADVFINVPKLKSHMKAGLTCAMKNVVGINGHKDYLPHFRYGSPKQGGDEYPDGGWLWDFMWRLVHADWERDTGWQKRFYQYSAMACYTVLAKLHGWPVGYLGVGGGGWEGNDTLWRTVLDINRAFLYFDPATRKVSTVPSQRRYFAIVDGLVGGHRESPLAPTPIDAGFVLAGENPVALDMVAATAMGFAWQRIRQLSRAFDQSQLPLAGFRPKDVRIAGLPGVSTIEDMLRTSSYVRFEPSIGFRGTIEWDGTPPKDLGSPGNRAARGALLDEADAANWSE